MKKSPRVPYTPGDIIHKYNIRFIFSHPDYTVGSGITPDHALRSRALPPVRESHPTPKNFLIYFINRCLLYHKAGHLATIKHKNAYSILLRIISVKSRKFDTPNPQKPVMALFFAQILTLCIAYMRI